MRKNIVLIYQATKQQGNKMLIRGTIGCILSLSLSLSFSLDGDPKSCCWPDCPSICVRRVATPRLTNAWAGPLPSSGASLARHSFSAPHLHQQATNKQTLLRGKETA